jgi:hypothetical protein
MDNLKIFRQGEQIVYKNLIILLTLFLLLAFFVYVSYILSDNKNYPTYLTEYNFDLFQNNSNLNQITQSTTVNNKIYNNISNFTQIDFCPSNQCAVNLSTGVKICPVTTNNGQNSGVTYDSSIQECVAPNTCPAPIPYAISKNGEALTNTCDIGDNCYCTMNPQCATRNVKYFYNTSGDNPSGVLQNQLNYSFNTVGNKPDDNIYNNITLDSNQIGNQFCKLNPAFTDKIIGGCDFTNRWSDSLNCLETNTYVLGTLNKEFIVMDFFEAINEFNIPTDYLVLYFNIDEYFLGSNFIAITYTGNEISNEQLKYSFAAIGSITINNYNIIFGSTEFKNNNILLKNISSSKNGVDIYTSGLPFSISNNNNYGVSVNFNQIENCQNNFNDNVNFKNMLNCVQTYKQPCSEGVLAYNIDIGDARQFCQGQGNNLSLNSIQNFFLTQPAIFTLSCVIGQGCDDSIDTNLCTSNTDCTNAFIDKNNKLFPSQDQSALTNLFSVEPLNYGFSFASYMTYTDPYFNLFNNYINLENGDYWEMNTIISDVFLISNGVSGSSIINVNNSLGLSIGMSINLSQSFKIDNKIGTSIYLNGYLNSSDQYIARTGYELFFYGENNYFGTVKDVVYYNNKQVFQLIDLNNNIMGNNLDINNNNITFYKQFGFNGLNYNTKYSYNNNNNNNNNNRIFSNDYIYNVINNDISLPFSIYEFINNNNKLSALLNDNNNFKQKYSMYYPVFNENYFQQECVYCSPSLQVYPYINNGGVRGYNIQFSGQDYYHYAYGNINGNWGFNQISFGLTDINSSSTATTIILNKPIANLSVGDYIIDQDGVLEKSFTNNNSNNFTIPTINNNIVADDKYLPYKLNGRVFQPPNPFTFTTEGANVENLFYGKVYINDGNECYINPAIQITKISSDGTIITTNSYSIESINPKKIIQFISASNNLAVSVVEDPQDTAKALGNGCEMDIESIANGRIVSLKINNVGTGYRTENKPIIYVSNFNSDTSILQIST